MAKSPLLTGVSMRATISSPKTPPAAQPVSPQVKTAVARMTSSPQAPARMGAARRPALMPMGGRKRNY